jgi:hypothetical protein
MNLPDGAEFVDRKDKVITEVDTYPIHDFTMVKNDSTLKTNFCRNLGCWMIVTYDLEQLVK